MLAKELSMANAKSDSILTNRSMIAMQMYEETKHLAILGTSLRKQLIMKSFGDGMKRV